jgi:hypothetical protein
VLERHFSIGSNGAAIQSIAAGPGGFARGFEFRDLRQSKYRRPKKTRYPS